MFKFVKRVLTDESGASGTEYAILLAIVGAAVFTGVGFFTTAFETIWDTLTADMTSWV